MMIATTTMSAMLQTVIRGSTEPTKSAAWPISPSSTARAPSAAGSLPAAPGRLERLVQRAQPLVPWIELAGLLERGERAGLVASGVQQLGEPGRGRGRLAHLAGRHERADQPPPRLGLAREVDDGAVQQL